MSKTPFTMAFWSISIAEPALNSRTTPYREPGQRASSALNVCRVPLCSSRARRFGGTGGVPAQGVFDLRRARSVQQPHAPSPRRCGCRRRCGRPVPCAQSPRRQRAMSAAVLTMPPSPTVKPPRPDTGIAVPVRDYVSIGEPEGPAGHRWPSRRWRSCRRVRRYGGAGTG